LRLVDWGNRYYSLYGGQSIQTIVIAPYLEISLLRQSLLLLIWRSVHSEIVRTPYLEIIHSDDRYYSLFGDQSIQTIVITPYLEIIHSDDRYYSLFGDQSIQTIVITPYLVISPFRRSLLLLIWWLVHSDNRYYSLFGDQSIQTIVRTPCTETSPSQDVNCYIITQRDISDPKHIFDCNQRILAANRHISRLWLKVQSSKSCSRSSVSFGFPFLYRPPRCPAVPTAIDNFSFPYRLKLVSLQSWISSPAENFPVSYLTVSFLAISQGVIFRKPPRTFVMLYLLSFLNGTASLQHPYRTGVLNLSRPGATFALLYRFSGSRAINEGDLLKLSWQFIKNATELICKQVHILLINFFNKVDL
jgi:hypothetical protein